MTPTTKPIITLAMDHDLLKRVEDFRFTHRFSSRSAALKWLLVWALDQNPTLPKKKPTGKN